VSDSDNTLNAVSARLMNAFANLDLEEAMGCLSSDAVIAAGGSILARGTHQTRRLLAGVFASFNAVSYRVAAMWSRKGVSVIEADVIAEWDAGATLRLPLTTVMRVNGDRVVGLHVFCYEPDLPVRIAASIRPGAAFVNR
jgi:hypothetical protein